MNKTKEKEIQDAFFLVDHDKDGFINKKEIGMTLRSLGIYLTKDDISQIEKTLDEKISLDKLKSLYQAQSQSNPRDKFIEAFKFFDKDNKGYININEIKHGLMVLGEQLTEDEIKTIIEESNMKEEQFDYVKFVDSIYPPQKN